MRALQWRLVIAFVGVVTLAIAIVLVTLPNLLDGYFAQQEQKNLDARARVIATVVTLRIGLATGGSNGAAPIVLPTDPPTASSVVADALGRAGDSSGLLEQVTSSIAESDLELTISTSPDSTGTVAYRLTIPYRPPQPIAGQEPDTITDTYAFRLADTYWSQFPGQAPARLVTITLSHPWTYRAQTLRDVVGVMLLGGLIAVAVSIVLAVFIATRLTTPIRRLTLASRALAEGDFDARVTHAADSGAPEVAELGVAFNRMADRLQESIELIRRDRDRSRDFLADVSHELRTPLAALRTFNELLQEGADDDPSTRAEFLESSRGQIERLDWLAQNLLDLSKLDSGLVALDLRPDDLRATVEDALEQSQPAASRRGVRLVADLPPEPVRQRHDPQRLAQVLSNLIGNSLKFTPPGGSVRVALSVSNTGARLRVSDTGVGIDPGELPHVFDRFYRGTRAGEVRAAGSGLGLSIVRSIVEMHGGRVAIESTPGQGTSVSVDLPRDVVQSSPAPSPL
ncbi:MAG TPA: HAMP domain-containing sensor histidine kinase [Candidatus Limnocylindrales bacterium]|nr:HAMP domain-containing sensor histidine kinase [Candidatus Limnocylindrales bacterium]